MKVRVKITQNFEPDCHFKNIFLDLNMWYCMCRGSGWKSKKCWHPSLPHKFHLIKNGKMHKMGNMSTKPCLHKSAKKGFAKKWEKSKRRNIARPTFCRESVKLGSSRRCQVLHWKAQFPLFPSPNHCVLRCLQSLSFSIFFWFFYKIDRTRCMVI